MFRFALVWLLLSASAFAQVEVKSATYYKLDGIGDLTTIGDLTLSNKVPQVVATPVGVIRVDTEAANIEVSVSDERRTPYEAKKLTPHIWLIDKPGRWWIDVTAIDFNKNIYGRKQAVVDVGVGPEPGPGPGPGPAPTPDGPFDGLASKVARHAQHLPAEHRATIVRVLNTAADSMQSFQFRQSEQARVYIQSNWPQCTSPHCGALWNLVLEDSRQRNLGWQEIQAYYREVAKGVR